MLSHSWLRRAIVTAILASVLPSRSAAQSLPACSPPNPGEYLLMVSTGEPSRLAQVLPASAQTQPCDYVGYPVVRVGGFLSGEIARAWAQYLQQQGFQSFVARPPGTAALETNEAFPSPTLPAVRSSAPAATPPAVTASASFSPRSLGNGYAVLVSYFNRPEVAADLLATIDRPVGLAVYNRRPYLLALHAIDASTAASTVQTLNDRGFTAIMVDSRRVVLLTAAVAGVN